LIVPRAAQFRTRLGLLGVLACVGAIALPGCKSEDKILKYKPFFTNIKDAVTQTPAVGVGSSGPTTMSNSPAPVSDDGATASSDEPVDPAALAEGYYDRIAKLPDHMVKLEAGDIGTLIRHLRWTLDEDRDEVLIDQLLAEDLLEELHSRRQEPEDYVDWLHQNRRDVEAMLARMPMAERSPTVVYEQTGRRQYRVRLTGSAERGLKFTELWVVMERGKYRLLWIS
jgi:hypothetical protein